MNTRFNIKKGPTTRSSGNRIGNKNKQDKNVFKPRGSQFYSLVLTKNKKQLMSMYNEMGNPRQRQNITSKLQGKMQNIGGKQIYCIERKSTKEKLWSTARKVDELRKVHIKNTDVTAPTDEMINQVANAVYRRISEITSFLMNETMNSNAGRIILEEKFENSTRIEKTEARKRIDEILKNIISSHVLKAEEKRTEIKITKNQSIYVNESQKSHIHQISPDVHHEFIETNDLEFDKFEKSYEKKQKRLQNMEKEFNCKCPGGNCGRKCPCASLDAALRSGLINDPSMRRHHSCNKECGCKGKCSQSFQEPPQDGTEIVLHSETRKGCAVRAKQYFGQGETVAEIRGQVIPTSSLRPNDEYGFDILVKEIDVPVLGQLLIQNKTVEAITEEYEKTIQKVIQTELSINPRDKSNEGRFISCSCFGNTIRVFQRGLNPANIRVMFTSLIPIYPNQEVTYCYSPQYICHQLKDVCLCGELCCIRNRELFPFITKEDIHKFYKTLYQYLHEEYISNIASR